MRGEKNKERKKMSRGGGTRGTRGREGVYTCVSDGGKKSDKKNISLYTTVVKQYAHQGKKGKKNGVLSIKEGGCNFTRKTDYMEHKMPI